MLIVKAQIPRRDSCRNITFLLYIALLYNHKAALCNSRALLYDSRAAFYNSGAALQECGAIIHH
jgi:hypothetical protein